MDVRLSVRREDERDTPLRGLQVEVHYVELLSREDGGTDAIPRTVRLELGDERMATVTLKSADPDRVTVSILTIDGTALLTRAVRVQNGVAEFTITAADIDAIERATQALPTEPAPLIFARTAQFLPTGTVTPDFTKCRLSLAVIRTETELSTSGIAALLQIEQRRAASIVVNGRLWLESNDLEWTTTHIGVDGRFTAWFEQQPSVGWAWWLTGAVQVVGFVPDSVSKPAPRLMALALPALSPPTVPADHREGCGKTVRADVTEAEIVNNPGIYTEDPGAFCKPFNNPERVLSERSFSVVARITQPDIGPLGSIRLKSQYLLNLDPLPDRDAPTASAAGSGTTRARSSAIDDAIAGVLAPRRTTLEASYRADAEKLPSGRTKMDAEHPLQWEDDVAQYQAATISLGHILEFRVRWRSNGYSLGNVVSTLTLAPRQAKRIQKITFERLERSRREEHTSLSDEVNDRNTRDFSYSDAVAANLREWASGSSSSSSAAVAGGFGFFGAGVLGAIGGGASTARSTSQSDGGRNTAASEQQRLNDEMRRHGDALRKFDSTVVQEVRQEETVTGSTEIVRNPNYGHSLTVIYHQILRHLKVNTEFAGVRECLFVPFSIKPFNIQRAYRWRESIQAAIRVPRFGRALRFLRDVYTNFATSGIPEGHRAAQRLTFLRGSIYVSIAIERPADRDDGKFDFAKWQVIGPFLGAPAFGIYSRLAAMVEANRDAVYQREHAPTVAARWADRIRLKVAGADLDADFTLATRYGFNRTVRIDFTVPFAKLDGLKRESITTMAFVAGGDLPAGSVANLTKSSITYGTERFERTVQGRSGTADVIAAETGAADEAQVALPLDPWERVDERAEMRQSVQELVEHLNEHVVYYTKASLWGKDRDDLLMMMDGFYVPGVSGNVSLASVVDREPIGIIGNCLVYRVGAASFIGYGEITDPRKLYDVYADRESQSELLVSLPSDGVYAQTIMDECLALEEHQGSVDWVLNETEPDLGVIDPSLLDSRRSDSTVSTLPTNLPGTIINLQNTPDAPAPTGLQGVLDAVTNANAFRDMAGLAGTQANAAAALSTAANLATNFGNQAAAIKLADVAAREQATRNVNRQVAAVRTAQDKGLLTQDEAAEHANRLVQQMYDPDANKNAPLTQEEGFQEAVRNGGGFTATRVDDRGAEMVEIRPAVFASYSQEDDAASGEAERELSECEKKIIALADQSPLIQFPWPGRGVAPVGYIRGMALTYGRVHCKWKANDPFVLEMAKADSGKQDTDVLAWYRNRFAAAGMDNSADGVDTLRHLFVLLIGLGMRESSGEYCEGRDMTASNVSPTSAEAGLFQMSYDIGVGSSNPARAPLKNLYDTLKLRPYDGYRSIFAQNVRCRSGQLAGFGTTPGGEFRKFCIMEPALSAEVAALGLRMRRRHWGPIGEFTVALNQDCDALLKDVRQMVDAGSCCSDLVPQLPSPA